MESRNDVGETARESDASPGLIRALGPSMATAVVVGSVIGAGIFLKPGNIAADSGSFPVIISVWVLGGVLCILGALCFAELATMLPHAGGLYVYLRSAYGDLVAFLFGWTETLCARPASTGALAMAFVGSLTLAWEWNLSDWTRVLLASLLIVALTWVNVLGVIWGGRMQLAVTTIKVVFLAFVALSPFLLAPLGDGAFHAANYSTTAEPRQLSLAAQIGAVLLAVMWAYNGWEAITPLAEEVHHPERNIPLSLFAGVGLLMVLYVGANLAYHGVLTMEEMRKAGDHAAELMLQRLAGPVGRLLMSAMIMCSTFGAINTNLLYGPRVAFAMARDGLLFRPLATVHATYRTPVIAILLSSAVSILMIVVVTIGKQFVSGMVADSSSNQLSDRFVQSLQNNSTFDLLTNMVIFALSVFYALAVFAVILLRHSQPTLPRVYRTWGYPWTPGIFLVSYAWFLWQIYQSNPLESRAGIGFLLVGLPAFYLCRSWERSATGR